LFDEFKTTITIRREIKEVGIDTTVKEKNITFPTDRKLYEPFSTISVLPGR
jgi:hypothetical protein